MPKNLVIVESPAKAKTIEGYLGKDFQVKSSFGHVRDLAKKNGVDVENNFQPTYEVLDDKKEVINDLRKAADKAEVVWLASDEDREGEAISWHLKEALELKVEKTKRIVFNEITKTAILRAIDNPRSINQDLVNAQQARRVLDRLVGFELSPILWKKVKPSLSAGRVQSVAVRLIVEKERDISKFEAKSAFRITAHFTIDGKNLKADLNTRFKTEPEAHAFLEGCKSATFSIKDLQKKPAKKSPAAPFTTSTLQQEASRKLGYSVAQTMTVAQRLYESGNITYMRTDSVNLSDLALEDAKKKIIADYGPEFANPKKYRTKNKSAQEAHEAIRPTNLAAPTVEADSSEQRLYELIWKRTVASQMADAQLERTVITIDVTGADNDFVAQGEVIKFEGFLKVYLESKDDEDEDTEQGLLPPVNVGDPLTRQIITATQRFTHHPARYSEASLVKKLEEQGIGRPSTYAPTISTIQKRGYVVREDRPGSERSYQYLELKDNELVTETRTEITGREKSKLFPSDIGIVVNDFLVQHFDKVMSFDFTANVEKDLDEIASGGQTWDLLIKNFYGDFHASVEDTLENAERATGERELGVHPESGKRIIARIGRYGPMVQIGDTESEEKPQFASLLSGQSIESISLDEALDLFKLPRVIGEYEGETVTAAIGRFGPYVKFAKLFVSLKKTDGDDPMTVTLDRAIELIEAKKKAEAEKYIKTFDENEDVQVLNGRYGPYIKIGKKNFRIPKEVVPADLTLEECLKIAEEAPKTKGKRRAKKS